ncbi:MAG: hypothetical protein ABH883_01275, partial [Candidatus Omnitrophota bacterium]
HFFINFTTEFFNREAARRPADNSVIPGSTPLGRALSYYIKFNAAKEAVNSVFTGHFSNCPLPSVKLVKGSAKACEWDGKKAIRIDAEKAYDRDSGDMSEEARLFDMRREVFRYILNADKPVKNKKAMEIAAVFLSLLDISVDEDLIHMAKGNKDVSGIFQKVMMGCPLDQMKTSSFSIFKKDGSETMIWHIDAYVQNIAERVLPDTDVSFGKVSYKDRREAEDLIREHIEEVRKPLYGQDIELGLLSAKEKSRLEIIRSEAEKLSASGYPVDSIPDLKFVVDKRDAFFSMKEGGYLEVSSRAFDDRGALLPSARLFYLRKELYLNRLKQCVAAIKNEPKRAEITAVFLAVFSILADPSAFADAVRDEELRRIITCAAGREIKDIEGPEILFSDIEGVLAGISRDILSCRDKVFENMNEPEFSRTRSILENLPELAGEFSAAGDRALLKKEAGEIAAGIMKEKGRGKTPDIRIFEDYAGKPVCYYSGDTIYINPAAFDTDKKQIKELVRKFYLPMSVFLHILAGRDTGLSGGKITYYAAAFSLTLAYAARGDSGFEQCAGGDDFRDFCRDYLGFISEDIRQAGEFLKAYESKKVKNIVAAFLGGKDAKSRASDACGAVKNILAQTRKSSSPETEAPSFLKMDRLFPAGERLDKGQRDHAEAVVRGFLSAYYPDIPAPKIDFVKDLGDFDCVWDFRDTLHISLKAFSGENGAMSDVTEFVSLRYQLFLYVLSLREIEDEDALCTAAFFLAFLSLSVDAEAMKRVKNNAEIAEMFKNAFDGDPIAMLDPDSFSITSRNGAENMLMRKGSYPLFIWEYITGSEGAFDNKKCGETVSLIEGEVGSVLSPLEGEEAARLEQKERQMMKTAEAFVTKWMGSVCPGQDAPLLRLARGKKDAYCEWKGGNIIHISPEAFEPDSVSLKPEVSGFYLVKELWLYILNNSRPAPPVDGHITQIAAVYLAVFGIMSGPDPVGDVFSNKELEEIMGHVDERFRGGETFIYNPGEIWGTGAAKDFYISKVGDLLRIRDRRFYELPAGYIESVKQLIQKQKIIIEAAEKAKMMTRTRVAMERVETLLDRMGLNIKKPETVLITEKKEQALCLSTENSIFVNQKAFHETEEGVVSFDPAVEFFTLPMHVFRYSIISANLAGAADTSAADTAAVYCGLINLLNNRDRIEEIKSVPLIMNFFKKYLGILPEDIKDPSVYTKVLDIEYMSGFFRKVMPRGTKEREFALVKDIIIRFASALIEPEKIKETMAKEARKTLDDVRRGRFTMAASPGIVFTDRPSKPYFCHVEGVNIMVPAPVYDIKSVSMDKRVKLFELPRNFFLMNLTGEKTAAENICKLASFYLALVYISMTEDSLAEARADSKFKDFLKERMGVDIMTINRYKDALDAAGDENIRLLSAKLRLQNMTEADLKAARSLVQAYAKR